MSHLVILSIVLSSIGDVISIVFAIKGIIASIKKTIQSAKILKNWYKIWCITMIISVLLSIFLGNMQQNILESSRSGRHYRSSENEPALSLVKVLFVMFISTLILIACCSNCVYGLNDSIHEYEIRLNNRVQYVQGELGTRD